MIYAEASFSECILAFEEEILTNVFQFYLQTYHQLHNITRKINQHNKK